MQNVKILIVDDEQPARRKIRSFLKKQHVSTDVLEAVNGVEAVTLIFSEKPQIVFLDIQMPGMNGFEVIEKVGVTEMPPVVFVTAFDQFALDAFEVQAVDYLLKPFDLARFTTSFNRVLQQLEVKEHNASLLRNVLTEIHKQKDFVERILVSVGCRYYFVNTADILYISAEEKYVNLHTENTTHLIRNTMSGMEDILNPAHFKRIHRSFIVNLDYIKELQPWGHGDYVVILKNETKLTLSRRYRDRLFNTQ